MKKIIILFLSILLMQAQITPKEVIASWDRMTEMVVGSVEKMPAKHFNFSPIDPLAEFAKLVNHTSGANYLFAATVKLEKPNISTNATKKDDVISDLKASFTFIRGGLEKLDQSDLNERIEWFGREMTRLNAILTMTDHLQREYGKIITYLRLKQTAPVRSSGW